MPAARNLETADVYVCTRTGSSMARFATTRIFRLWLTSDIHVWHRAICLHEKGKSSSGLDVTLLKLRYDNVGVQGAYIQSLAD